MWPESTAAQKALMESHSIVPRVTVTSPFFGSAQVGIRDGSVVADARSQVRRTATLEIDPTLWPRSPTDLLAPFGATAFIEYGIVLPKQSEPEWVPLGLFSLDETSRSRPFSSDASVQVKLVDMSARVAEDRFDVPVQTVPGATVVAEIVRLVRETLGPDWPYIDLTGSTQVAPRMEIEEKRWEDGVEKLATSIGAEAFFDQVGRLVIRPQPTLSQIPVWTIRTGDGGNLLTQRQTLSRDLVYNRVTASGERSDGSPLVYATVSDTNPNSPTRYGGPFGRKPRRFSSPLLTTHPQCLTMAQALLEKVKGISAQVDNETLVQPGLDPGDVVTVLDESLGPLLSIVDKCTTPLRPDGTQPIGARSEDLPPES